MTLKFRGDESRRVRRQVERCKYPAATVRLECREKPPRAGPAQRADLEDAPRPELADHHVEHRRLDAAYLTTARPCRVLELTRRVELGAELGRVLVHEARVVLREARGRRRLHKIMAAGEKEAARPAGVNETQGCRRAEPVETHDLGQLPTRGAQEAGSAEPLDPGAGYILCEASGVFSPNWVSWLPTVPTVPYLARVCRSVM